MADNIDNLSFGIILKDEDFKKRMNEVKGLAKTFSDDVAKALSLTNMLASAQGKSVGNTEKKVGKQKEIVTLTRQELEAKKAAGTATKAELQQLNALIRVDKAILDEEKKLLDIENKQLTIKNKKEAAERRHAQSLNETNRHIKHQSVLMQQINSYLGMYLSVFGGIRLIQSLVRITGEFEAQHTALRAILQDSAGADRIFYQLQELAVKSPYTFRDLTSYAKQLSAFSIPMDEIYDTTKKLADVSAGLGVDMGRIILAYGQVRSAAFLRGQEVRQFTEAGIPILAELAKLFEEIEGHAVSTGEVFDRISKRQVPFEMVEEAFRRMTSEGGKFYNMQEVLAETVKGKISNLQDSWEIMLSKVGDANSGLIKGSISLITELINNYEKLGKVLIEVTAGYGAYKAALMTTNALQAASAVSARFFAVTGGQISAVEVLLNRLFRTASGGLNKIWGLIARNPYAVALGIIAGGVTALTFHIRKMNEATRETEKITTKAIADAEATKSTIYYYIQRLKEAKEGTEEYNEARMAVIENSKNFISSTDAERLSLQNVDDVWMNICNHIEEATKLQAMQSVTADAEARRQEAQLKIMDRLAEYQNTNGLTNGGRMNVAAYVRGEIDKNELIRRLQESGVSMTRNGGYFSPGTDILFRADEWQKAFNSAEQEYDKAIKLARQKLSDLYGSGKKAAPAEPSPLTGWRVGVDNYLKAIGGGARGMEVTLATDLASYIKKGADALDAARDALLHTPKNDADYKRLEEEIKFYEGISQAIYGGGFTEFDNTTQRYKTQQKDISAAQKDRLDNLKQQFQNLKELKSAYDAFKGIGFDDKQIDAILNNFFGIGIPASGFDSAFNAIASQMQGLDANDAQDVRNFASGKDWREYFNSEKARVDAEAKALEDYNKRIQGYIEDAKSIQQKINDLEKQRDEDLAKATTDEQRQAITAHYADEIDKLRESLVDLTSIQLTEFWQQLTGEKNGTYRNLTRLQEKAGELIGILKGIEPNRNKDGKITGYTLTQGNAGDFLKSIGVDAQSLQLSVAQVEALNKAFESLFGRRAEKNGMSALFDMIKKRGIKNFWKDIKDGGGPAVETLTEAAEQLSQIGSIFTELGEAAGSGFLSSFGETMSFFGDVAGQIAKRDYIAAVGVTVKALASGITDALALKRAIGEAADEAERFNTEARLSSGVDTIFGENTLTKVRNAMSVMNEYSDAVAREREWSGKSVRWKAGIFGWDRGFGRLSRIVGELGYDLYDSYGNLNAEALQAILDKYDKLTDKSREWITEALRDSEMYAEAVEQLDDVVEGVFGSIADDLTDTFIDNFVQMGYAVDDLGDTFTNLGDTILRSMLKSYIMDEILDKYGERARELMKRAADGTASADETAEGVRKLAEDVESDARLLAPTIQEMIEAFKDRGLINVDSSGDSSLSGGIKGITEDTANLLASYLNAIRADVSYGKAQWERIAAAVEGHSMQYVTLNDYLMQVQANTANIAESNRKILDRIESVLTSEGGLPAIRTYS